jgi:hypothetical protein
MSINKIKKWRFVMKIIFRRDTFELVKQSIELDNDTYVSKFEKDLVLSSLNHFFKVNKWKKFYKRHLDLNTYDKFYKGAFKKHHTEFEEMTLANRIMEESDEKKFI